MEEKCLPPDSKVTRSNDSYCEGGGHDCRDGRWHRAAWVGRGAAPCPREHAPGWFKPHTWAPQKGPAPYSHWTPQEAARPGSARGERQEARHVLAVTWCWSPAAPWSQRALLFRAPFSACYEEQDVSRKVSPLTLLAKPTAIVTKPARRSTRPLLGEGHLQARCGSALAHPVRAAGVGRPRAWPSKRLVYTRRAPGLRSPVR